MWRLVPMKYQFGLVLAGVVLSFYLAQNAYGYVFGDMPATPEKWSLLFLVSAAILAGLVQLIWSLAWHWLPSLQRHTFPNLNGTWTGQVVSTYSDPATGIQVPPIQVAIAIRQGFFSTSVTFKSGETKSQTTQCFLKPFYQIGKFRIWYIYDTDPQAQFRSRSMPHEGVCYLDLYFDEDRNKLRGTYHTERKTTGEIVVARSFNRQR
ncbi:hypothetical protein GF108_19900 [Phyllobacterium sp. SYP-B3895]|uniref:Cap15 family cyclic dinucleotide receptor domain-containing protein n=1 Tax=Phyllobacterium sp. SYP-B3895 TaxID=2663240 RepID=UPI0012996008|nr:hypothetical protein [Phyllobacterium sp. SYP-B3895]MRG57830.1 hypothetical protein [Phyllobacterium sp. SYP-B3895]